MRSKRKIITGINKVHKRFKDRSFKITAYHSDNEFEYLREAVSLTPLHIVVREEHVGTVERSIRVVKERVRYHCQILPHKKMPKLMIDELLEIINTNLN